MKKQKRVAAALCIALLAVLLPAVALALDGVKYIDADGVEKTANNVTEITTTTAVWNGGWYVVNSSVTITARIEVNGDVHLILGDGCVLKANNGIKLSENNRLTIYAQSNGNGSGTLEAIISSGYDAGIGANEITDDNSDGCGTLTVNGGSVTAVSIGGAGIGGGGSSANHNGGDGGTVTINGGTVEASSTFGVGIGGGTGKLGGNGGIVTINGGTVTANSGSCVGIGGGDSLPGNRGGNGGTVTITGGTVTATTTARGSRAIGGGRSFTGLEPDHGSLKIKPARNQKITVKSGNDANAGEIASSPFTTASENVIGEVTGLYFNSQAVKLAPTQLTVTGTTVADKEYDGNTDAAVTLGTVAGIVSGDDVTVTATGSFDTPDVGTDKPVAVTYALSGPDADKYLAPVGETLYAAIRPSSAYNVGLADGAGNPLTSYAFPAQQQGYNPRNVPQLTVTVKNLGSQATGELAIGLSGNDPGAFSLAETSLPSIAVGGTASFSVSIVGGYAPCTYNATVTVSSPQGSVNPIAPINFSTSFTVTAPFAVAAPVFAPAEGTYAAAQNVTLTCATAGAAIYYTTDGTEPTQRSAYYAAPIRVTATTTLKARAIVPDRGESAVASATYTITGPVPPVPTDPPVPSASDAPKTGDPTPLPLLALLALLSFGGLGCGLRRRGVAKR